MSIINIRGTNATGKSTLAKAFLGVETTVVDLAPYSYLSPTKKDPNRVKHGHIQGLWSPSNDLCLLGTYRNTCGGCDEYSFKGSHPFMRDAIRAAADQYRHVIYEGIIVSSVYGPWYKFAQEMKAHWVCLVPPIDETISRVLARNGGKILKDDFANLRQKHAIVVDQVRKVREAGEAWPQLHVFEDIDAAYPTVEALLA